MVDFNIHQAKIRSIHFVVSTFGLRSTPVSLLHSIFYADHNQLQIQQISNPRYYRFQLNVKNDAMKKSNATIRGCVGYKSEKTINREHTEAYNRRSL